MAFWQALRTWAVFALNCAFQANCSHTSCSTTKDTLHYIWLGLDLSTGGDLFIPKADMEWESMRTACKAQLRAQVSWKFTVLQSLWEKSKPDIVTASFSPLWLDRARYLIFKVMAVGCKMQIFDGGRVLMSKCKNSEKSVQKKYNRGKRIDVSHQGPRGTWWQGRGKPRARG